MPENRTEKEKSRIADLEAYQILDTEAESAFDELVELASAIAETPISLISLIDEHRQWFKAKRGLQVSETPREYAFCAHAIESEAPSFIVENATEDSRFATNPLVTADPAIRFYAGFPLVTPKGNKLGTLCVIDQKARTLTPQQEAKLQLIAKQVMKLLDLHLAKNKLQLAQDAGLRQKEALKTLLKSQKKVIALLAHDTRGPLSSIKYAIEMIISGQIPASQLQHFLAMIAEQAGITIEMFDNIIQWGEIHLLAAEREGATGNIREVTANIVKQYAAAAEMKGIELVVELEDCRPIQANDQMIGFVIRNLVNNAIKYTEQGQVKVSGQSAGNFYRLSVSDTGAGMSPTQKAALFKGKAISSPGTRNEQGSGFGLMLISDFVQQVGGHIAVESEPGKGSRVSIDLPYK